MPKEKATLNVTIPPELMKWLNAKVKERVFASRSHGVELCLLEGETKFGPAKKQVRSGEESEK
jgi:Arc/MetJ-type ribon-helix-helix transcriptional regulator